jgi:hypothetical protein
MAGKGHYTFDLSNMPKCRKNMNKPIIGAINVVLLVEEGLRL